MAIKKSRVSKSVARGARKGTQANERKRDDPAWVAWSRQIRLNVVPVHDFQDTMDGPSLVMPYYELGNLKDLRPVSEDLCVKVLLDLLLGLSHLHGRLENLLVEKPFNIIIADFGLSKFAEDKLFTTFCGTAEILAPEVFPGVQASYGPKADVWSAAILLMTFYLSGIPKPNHLK
ncbi:MAG: Protein kinase domain-containing protein [Peltula sp. TS41687]|nr:MAG: Protein kinase domain-containing protein [Peltula sp. TS41687]